MIESLSLSQGNWHKRKQIINSTVASVKEYTVPREKISKLAKVLTLCNRAKEIERALESFKILVFPTPTEKETASSYLRELENVYKQLGKIL